MQLVTTRGRYALMVLIDLAEHNNGNYIPMKEIAKRQDISHKYLEQIMPILMKDKIIDGASGKGGGYRLNRPPEEYIVGEILSLTEGSLAPVACLAECNSEKCDRTDSCRTHPMWEKYNEMTMEYFNSITIADLMKKS
ncbi:MAG: Rrf2 family transcriptional regulator [Oscillospiraceae bacterium]|nr:Rrf2 family transcriptional regulator [Oscillospiraceae bacterium]